MSVQSSAPSESSSGRHHHQQHHDDDGDGTRSVTRLYREMREGVLRNVTVCFTGFFQTKDEQGRPFNLETTFIAREIQLMGGICTPFSSSLAALASAQSGSGGGGGGGGGDKGGGSPSPPVVVLVAFGNTDKVRQVCFWCPLF